MEITVMSHSEIINAVSAIKNGCMCRIKYKSDLPIKALYKKQGIAIVKITDVTARTGVAYEHLASVIARKSLPDYVTPLSRANNYEWIIPNKVAYNTKTLRYSIRIATVNKHNNRKVKYMLIKENHVVEQISELTDDIKAYVQDSYWNRSSAPEIQNISFENIIAIN